MLELGNQDPSFGFERRRSKQIALMGSSKSHFISRQGVNLDAWYPPPRVLWLKQGGIYETLWPERVIVDDWSRTSNGIKKKPNPSIILD